MSGLAKIDERQGYRGTGAYAGTGALGGSHLHRFMPSEAATGVRGVSRHHEEIVAFTLRQFLDMWSPSNFIGTNPQVLTKTLAHGGTNLVSSFANWASDAIAVPGDGKGRGVERQKSAIYLLVLVELGVVVTRHGSAGLRADPRIRDGSPVAGLDRPRAVTPFDAMVV